MVLVTKKFVWVKKRPDAERVCVPTHRTMQPIISSQQPVSRRAQLAECNYYVYEWHPIVFSAMTGDKCPVASDAV